MAGKRVAYFDLLNILAIFGVIILHSSESVFSFQPSLRWDAAAILQILFIWSVPIFFMISGANLLNYRQRYTTKEFLKKRSLRVVAPFLFWSVMWYLRNMIMDSQSFSITKLIKGIIYNTHQNVFWFFYVIIAFYLLTPVISLITTKKNLATVKYMMSLSIVFEAIIVFILRILNRPLPFGSDYLAMFGTPFFIYFILGWYLHYNSLDRKKENWLLFVGGVVTIIEIIIVIVGSYAVKKPLVAVYDATGVISIIATACVWVIAKRVTQKVNSQRIQKFLQKIASYSLGVYIIHEFFISFAERVILLPATSWYHLFVLPVVVYLVSLLVIWLLKKIPFMNMLIP